jgi:hypothetical protein
MKRLSKRLKKLEASMSAPLANFSFDELERTTLNKLPVADRDLARAALASSDLRALREAYPAVWARWEQALREAIDELRFPFDIYIADFLV